MTFGELGEAMTNTFRFLFYLFGFLAAAKYFLGDE